ncbi:hypothetical protein B5F09_14060 [Erysipelatoclostridium sp. An173]|uniref:zinc-ribbon domain-containing protein n=1 Tax=Erysipelatoclostridium sp. An173 TaxID=1965571 RepID=UPI000B376883|nr:zinc ribbon domain-containing protein [Erysipelatoclostridium sp. An173]OUP70516.1 hypothetical protein B5F09_14060 [Erysipelatoclostridium sp. An173]
MKKCKKCGAKNEKDALFCYKCGNKLEKKESKINLKNAKKSIKYKSLIIGLITLSVVIVGIFGIVKFNLFGNLIGNNEEILNTKEARAEIFESDEFSKKLLKESLNSELNEMVKNNYLCINDLYLEESPIIEIIEEENKRARYLGEGYYMVEESNIDNDSGTIEYYLAYDDLKKIDSAMNSGVYDVKLDSQNRITEISQKGDQLYKLEYSGDDVVYKFNDDSYAKSVELDHINKDYYKVDFKDGTYERLRKDSIESNNNIDKTRNSDKVEIKNDLLMSAEGTDTQYKYDKNGLLVYYFSEDSEGNKVEMSYIYDFENGILYRFSNFAGMPIVEKNEISFAINPVNLTSFGCTNDFLKIPVLSRIDGTSYSYGTEYYSHDTGDNVYHYSFLSKDVLNSISYSKQGEITDEVIFNFDKDLYYYQYDSEELYENGLLIKFYKIDYDHVEFVIKYFDKNNIQNDSITSMISAEFDDITGETETFSFDSDGGGGTGQLTWENGNLVLSTYANDIKFACYQYDFGEHSQSEFNENIGISHDTE